MRVLHPEPGEIGVADAARFVGVALNMVASADGRAAHEGWSRPIAGGAGDRALFHALRAHADAVLVGAATVRAERYGSVESPVAAVVTREADPSPFADLAPDVRTYDSGSAAVAALRAAGLVRILCEGGPTLNAALLAAGLVDTLFLTVAPQLLGGADPLTIVADELVAPVALRLERVLEADGALLLRYGVR